MKKQDVLRPLPAGAMKFGGFLGDRLSLCVKRRLEKIRWKHLTEPFFGRSEDDGRVLGYAYAGRLKARRAFDWAVETSIYLAGDARGRGIGRALHDALAKELARMGVTNLYALVAATEDEDDPHLDDGSIRFHEHMGYREAGRLSRCGYKFDRWYDLVFMELDVAAHTSPAPARHAFAR